MSQRVLVMTPRPGRVVAEIAIDEPYPRPAEFRAQPGYAAKCGALLDALRGARSGAA
jgi:NitT/TauT family transport system ATP-binding protein